MHLGPYPTPSREDDPRHLPPNFHYDQQDLLIVRAGFNAWAETMAMIHDQLGRYSGVRLPPRQVRVMPPGPRAAANLAATRCVLSA